MPELSLVFHINLECMREMIIVTNEVLKFMLRGTLFENNVWLWKNPDFN